MKMRLLILTVIMLIGCGSTPAKPTGETKELISEKFISSLTPTYKEIYRLGTMVVIDYKSDLKLDSIKIFVDNKPIAKNQWISDRLGKINYKVIAYKGAEHQSLSGQFTVVADMSPRLRKVKIVRRHPHQKDAYTQGLLFHDGYLYESTGERGRSSIRQVDIETGNVKRKRDLDDKYFGEGVALLGDKLYQLTWEEGVVFVYDLNDFSKRSELPLSGEGWGITTDGTYLYIADGSYRISKYDPVTFKKISQIEVADDTHVIDFLNELEWINGKIWANVYTTDLIAIIDPQTGAVESYLDCRKLHESITNAAEADVLNGIAFDPKTGRIWLTGKDWDTLFEVTQ